jgi:hypothetical protein
VRVEELDCIVKALDFVVLKVENTVLVKIVVSVFNTLVLVA